MGGGKDPGPPAAPPAPPSPAETSAQAIQAQIDATPKIFETQKQFAPQFAQLELDQLQKFGPEFAKIATQIQDIAAPEISAAQESLTKFLSEGDEAEFQSLLPGLVDDVRSAQSARGIGAVSPLGAIDEAVQIQRLKQSLKDRRLNIALSTAGRQPIAGISPVSGSPGQLVNNIDPNSIFAAQNSLNQFNSSLYNTASNIFGTQVGANVARRGQNMQLIGDVVGAGGAAAGAFLGACWVASELFGGWFEPKTVLSRIYVVNYSPAWFRKLYLKYGENFAAFIKDKPVIKNILKPIFEVFASIGRRKING